MQQFQLIGILLQILELVALCGSAVIIFLTWKKLQKKKTFIRIFLTALYTLCYILLVFFVFQLLPNLLIQIMFPNSSLYNQLNDGTGI